MVLLGVCVEIVAVVLLADLVSGLVHWWEDSYARVDRGPLRRLAVDNLRHHLRPREFLAKGYWESSWDLWLLAVAVVAASVALDAFSWHVALFAALSANANQIHKWTHRTRDENGGLIGGLQRLHLLQTPRHHSRHHQGARDSHYCVITNFLNPLLEEVQFWRRLERAIECVSGLRRRSDDEELARLGVVRPIAPSSAPLPRPNFAVRLTMARLRDALGRPLPAGFRLWAPQFARARR